MGLIQSGPGSPLAFSSASGGKVFAYNGLTTATTMAAPANPGRQRVRFHNPGPVDIFIYPQYVVNTGSNVALAPTTSNLGGCFRVFGNGGTLEVEGECQGQWGVFATDDSGTACLTVMDSNT